MSNKEEIPQFTPCGEGDNICNCKKESECGYIEIYKMADKLSKPSAPIKEGEESEPKRCPFELHVEDFFGRTNVDDMGGIYVSFSELVNLVATYQPSSKVLSDEEKLEFLGDALCLNSEGSGFVDDFLSRYTIIENTITNSKKKRV